MPGTPPTIGIIEDDDSVRRAIGRLLRSAGLAVETFASAEEYLQAGGRPALGCLIVDVHLPGRSGLDLQEQLQAEGQAVPVVVITAYGDAEVRARALRAGAVAVLDKPFAEQALLDAVARAVQSSQ
jgi:FixJ family two-component response regulator